MVINFQERARLIQLERQFRQVAGELRRTRLQLASPLSNQEKKEIKRRRQEAISMRDQLERALDVRKIVTESGEVIEIRDIEGTKRKRKLLNRMPLEDWR